MMTANARAASRKQNGFSLVELMIAVAIGGMLSALAVPSFVKYMQRAKSTEAVQGVKKLYDGARAYYLDTPQPGLRPIDPQFPNDSIAPTPALGNCCFEGGKCAADASLWEDQGWAAMQFSVDDPHYYSYSYETPDETSQFTVRANGDLDCDGLMSTFEMAGRVVTQRRSRAAGPGGAVAPARFMTGSGAIRRLLDTE